VELGKTRLAVEWQARSPKNSPARLFCFSSPLSDPGLIAAVIAQTLESVAREANRALEILKESLRDSLGHSDAAPCWIIFEHLLPSAPTVAELLVMGPNLKFWYQRAALHLYGEHEFLVPPLGLPDPLCVPPVEDCPATPRSRCSFNAPWPPSRISNSTTITPPPLPKNLRAPDGLPLAIETGRRPRESSLAASLLTRLASRLLIVDRRRARPAAPSADTPPRRWIGATIF